MGVVTFSAIHEIFFKDITERGAYKVIQRIIGYGELDTERHFLVNERILWIPKNKPKQLKHKLLRSEFYKYMHSKVTIVKFERELTFFDGIRPDAFIAFETVNTNKYYGFLEVEISNNEFNTDKYINLYKLGTWREYMEVFPIIFAITNKKVKYDPNIKLLVIDEEFKNFNDIIKEIE
jgi:hypothetical protein